MSTAITDINSSTIDETICFRFLDESEYYKLIDIFEEYKGSIPNPKLSRIAIAETNEENPNDREIIGLYCFQLIPHAEPMWIKEEYRNTNIWYKLASMIEPLTQKKDTYIIATTELVERMCEAAGLEKLLIPVFVKRV
jgi:hypothetical protein